MRSDRSRLFVQSASLLFVELWLIRWSGAYVVYLAYFTNFILLASFLGIGVGFLRASRPSDRSRWAPAALAGFVSFVLLFTVEVHRVGTALSYTGGPLSFALPQWVMLPLLFSGAATVMALLGEGVARTFVRFDPLRAYLYDLTGSLIGVVLFAVLAFARVPPVGAAAVAIVLMLAPVARGERMPARAFGSLALLGVLGVSGLMSGDVWSPYYRITFEHHVAAHTISVSVNGVPHQTMKSVSRIEAENPMYVTPYEHLGPGAPLDDVLIVGAGSGNDVAVALSRGARHVDAVEIDPRLPELGRDLHPDDPFADPRVTVHVTDGRAFVDRASTTYDMILFALPDSLTLVSGQASLRLESYLFTIESMRAVRERLRPGGTFAMYNYYRRAWLVDRLAETIRAAFASIPCLDVLPGPRHPAVLTVARAPGSERCVTPWRPVTEPVPAPATDDHPFLYLRTPTVPAPYAVVLLLVLLGSALTVGRVSRGARAVRRYPDLFFMGAAFLLLETKNVVQFALLFGTTWVVNALVFAGILVTLILAVLTARRVRVRRPALPYAALFVALVAAWAIPPEALLKLALIPRFAAATALAFAPVFLANIVFSERFRDVGDSTAAFAANLLGAMLGGVLEYAALATGYRTLLVGAAILYVLAFALHPTIGPLRSARAPFEVPAGQRAASVATNIERS
jgi:SAM-dependent methyltransferase